MDYARLLDLTERNFIVLGAGQGIGTECARALAQCGARVFCVDLDEGRARAVAAEVKGHHAAADVTSAADVARVFAAARESFGRPVDGVVDVVGVAMEVGLSDPDTTRLDRQFDIVVRHAWLVLQNAKAHMTKGGAVVLIGSIAGQMARPGPLLGYSIAKAALHHMVRNAALELGKQGIRVNAVAPGLTKTPRLLSVNSADFWARQEATIPLGRVGTPADVGAAVLFLCGAMAAHITGQILVVDGGTTLTSATSAPENLSQG
jgi:NAD(P)-dependent dehydrogenase (short-subunit alcohol dehydrogenase family)